MEKVEARFTMLLSFFLIIDDYWSSFEFLKQPRDFFSLVKIFSRVIYRRVSQTLVRGLYILT
jgi:hypothetical protein